MRPLPDILLRLRGPVDAELREVLAGRRHPLYQMANYQLGWLDEQGQLREGAVEGRRTRPILCLLAAEALGADAARVLPAAAAVELVHNFSLVHDDIQDGNLERHGRPTVWWRWGPAQAINAGDSMHALGRLALFRLGDHGVPQEKIVQALSLLDEACLKLCEGQFLDLSFQERLDVSLEAYLQMVEGKTAALMGCALELAALVVTESAEVRQAFRSFGQRLGQAFQIHDDIQDLWGRENAAGFPRSNIMNKKKTLPVVYAFEKADVRQKRELGSLYMKRVLEFQDVQRVVAVLESVGAREFAQGLVHRFHQEALEALGGLDLVPRPLAELRDVSQFILSS